MKRLVVCLLLAGMLLGLTGCGRDRMEPRKIQDFLERAAERLGNGQLTAGEDLIGTRVPAERGDTYTGAYTAVCSRMTGRDVVFGGGSLRKRTLYLSGRMETASGRAAIRIRLNEDVLLLEPDADECFATTLKLDNGGNYIMVVYEDFSGSIDLTCVYAEREDTDEG